MLNHHPFSQHLTFLGAPLQKPRFLEADQVNGGQVTSGRGGVLGWLAGILLMVQKYS